MENCLFCKIISGEIPVTKVFEDKENLAFLDINPVNPGHTLVIPKKHSQNIFDIRKEDLSILMKTVQKISKLIKKNLSTDGINIISNNETAAGQIVYHTHIHIIPRFVNDGLKNWKGTTYQKGEAEKLAKKIRS